MFLPRGLAFARQHPIDEKLRRVRMRRPTKHSHAAGAYPHDVPFLHRMRHQINGQPLLFRLHDRLTAADVKMNLSMCQPIGALLQITGQHKVGLGEKSSYKFLPQGRRVIKEHESLAAPTGDPWIEAAKPPLPSRLE